MNRHQAVYLDNNATTPCDPVVLEAMLPYFAEWYGNAATGLHLQGRRAGQAVDLAREQLASLIGAAPHEIVFTGGATESNNLAILGVARRAAGGQRKRIVTTAIEHKAVLEPCRYLTAFGYELVILPVTPDGYVEPAVAETAIDERTLLVSIQAANNEIGTLQPVRRVAELAHQAGALVHCDAAQAVGKIPVDVVDWDLDLMSLSAHKFYGPKGIGVLYIRNGPQSLPLEPLVFGGGQERSVRSGTSNVPGIVGLGAAAGQCAVTLEPESKRIEEMRDSLELLLTARLDGARVNGVGTARLPNTTSLTLPGVDVDAILLNMPAVMLGVGSACSAGALEPSHVLQAIGLSRSDAGSTVRISLGRFNVADEIPVVVDEIVRAVSIANGGDREGN